MSAYREALQMKLVCPKCGEANRFGAAPLVTIQEDGETAECASCSCSGTLTVFLQSEAK